MSLPYVAWKTDSRVERAKAYPTNSTNGSAQRAAKRILTRRASTTERPATRERRDPGEREEAAIDARAAARALREHDDLARTPPGEVAGHVVEPHLQRRRRAGRRAVPVRGLTAAIADEDGALRRQHRRPAQPRGVDAH